MPLEPLQEERIRAEEDFRRNYQLTLTQRKETSAFISFINTNFGMWLLTVLLFGTATKIQSDLQESRNRRLSNEQQIEQLEWEIDFRLQHIRWKLFESGTEINALVADVRKDMYVWENGIAIHADYRGRSIPQLVTMEVNCLRALGGNTLEKQKSLYAIVPEFDGNKWMPNPDLKVAQVEFEKRIYNPWKSRPDKKTPR